MKKLTINETTQYHHLHPDGRSIPMEQIQVRAQNAPEPMLGARCNEDNTVILIKVMKVTMTEEDAPNVRPLPGSKPA